MTDNRARYHPCYHSLISTDPRNILRWLQLRHLAWVTGSMSAEIAVFRVRRWIWLICTGASSDCWPTETTTPIRWACQPATRKPSTPIWLHRPPCWAAFPLISQVKTKTQTQPVNHLNQATEKNTLNRYNRIQANNWLDDRWTEASRTSMKSHFQIIFQIVKCE